MSFYNYLLAQLQNLTYSRIVTAQISAFQIIEESSGVILDTTADCFFLDFLMRGYSSFEPNDQNQFLLNELQLKQYLSFRMYYYNPRMLDSLINNNFTSVFWLDPDDARTIPDLDQYNILQSMQSKHNSSSTTRWCDFGTYGNDIYYQILPIGDFCFGAVVTGNEACYYPIQNAGGVYPLKYGSNFIIAAVAIPSDQSGAGKVLSCIYNDDNKTWFRITRDGTSLKVTTYMKTGGVVKVNETVTLTSYDFSTPTIVIWAGTSDHVDVYIDDEEKETYNFTGTSSNNFTSKYIGDATEDEAGFVGKLFNLISIAGTAESETIDIIKTYFKTRYMLLE